MRTNKNVCLYCFGDLDKDRVCTKCRKRADDTPSPPHHIPQRTVLNGKYLLGKALGEGGFGITYLAWDLTNGVKIAIKEYFPSGFVTRVPKSNNVIINSKQNQSASNRGLKRFIDEAKNLAKIKNLSGIVNVRDFFSANGTAYIVMEFLDGISLKKYMQRKGGKITTDEILGIMRPVMDSLIEVHNLGLIHRDISPDNIIITKYNEVKLIDFGAAKQSNLDGKSLSIVLKQGFAPEEQYRTHGEQGPWTDVYALGVTIYYCITGQLPPESIQRMYKDTIVRPSELGATISPGQEAALMKALAVYAKGRYQNVSQLISGLYNPRERRRAASAPSAPSANSSVKPSANRDAAAAVAKNDASSKPSSSAKKAAETAKPAIQNKSASSAAKPPAPGKAAQSAKPMTENTSKAAAVGKAANSSRSASSATARNAESDNTKAAAKTKTAKRGIFARLFGKK
ncbi:MAG: serine/threonine protein kinase [Clostridia bacterium]|nr:serine/threonine protein kinase [Clostridia bacterium]